MTTAGRLGLWIAVIAMGNRRAIVHGMDSGEPFIGSEALACGVLNRHQLRTQYRALYPDVYFSNRIDPSLGQRTAAAWLWSGRRAVIAGAAAAALHGSKWIPDHVPLELIHRTLIEGAYPNGRRRMPDESGRPSVGGG